MAQGRTEYLRDLLADAERVTDKPEVIAAIVVGDALNGLRKSMLEIADQLEAIRVEQGQIAESAQDIRDVIVQHA